MLQLTQQAAAVLRDVRAQQHVPDHFGLRVSGSTADRDSGVQLNFVEEPIVGDEVTEHEGLKLFVAPELAEPLNELAIDVNAQSSASVVALRLREQGDLSD